MLLNILKYVFFSNSLEANFLNLKWKLTCSLKKSQSFVLLRIYFFMQIWMTDAPSKKGKQIFYFTRINVRFQIQESRIQKVLSIGLKT